MEQKIVLVSKYLSTVSSPGNLSIMFLEDNMDPVEVCVRHPKLTEVQVVDNTYKGNEIVSLYLKMKPDAVFVDFKKLRNDGIYAIGKIMEINPNAKIISV